MGSAPNVPKPSAAETANLEAQTKALQQQADIIQAQYQQQQLLAPFLYKSAGIQPQYGPNGEITGFQEINDPIRQLEQDVQQKFLERTQAALKGEIPLDPGLVRNLNQQEMTLREQLSKQLGPGYETSTPGIQALDEFMRSKEQLYDAARRGDLTLAEQLNLAQGQQNQAKLGDYLGQLTGINQNPLATAQAYGMNAAGYQGPISYYQRNRAMQPIGTGGGAGGALSGALSGAASGASMGSMFGPWGAAIGGLAGGIFGGVTGSQKRYG